DRNSDEHTGVMVGEQARGLFDADETAKPVETRLGAGHDVIVMGKEILEQLEPSGLVARRPGCSDISSCVKRPHCLSRRTVPSDRTAPNEFWLLSCPAASRGGRPRAGRSAAFELGPKRFVLGRELIVRPRRFDERTGGRRSGTDGLRVLQIRVN